MELFAKPHRGLHLSRAREFGSQGDRPSLGAKGYQKQSVEVVANQSARPAEVDHNGTGGNAG
jgi:hypothetical protein